MAAEETILENQKLILNNQETITKNQASILKNQEIIVSNQASIIDNQKQIADNQVALSVIHQTQAHMFNLIKKIAGKKESLKDTEKFLEKLTGKTKKSLKSKKLTASKKLKD
jgi:hypothetical protein